MVKQKYTGGIQIYREQNNYVEGCVVVLDSLEVLLKFGVIINVLLIKPDEPCLVCELLKTQEFSTHFHSYVVQRDKPIPIVFCKPDELSDHHSLGLYSLRFNHDSIPTNCDCLCKNQPSSHHKLN